MFILKYFDRIPRSYLLDLAGSCGLVHPGLDRGFESVQFSVGILKAGVINLLKNLCHIYVSLTCRGFGVKV